MRRFAAWLGLSDARADDEGGVPSWHGVSTRARRLCGAAWLLVAVATFALLRWLMPLDDGLAGTAPVVIAVLLGALGLAWTERALVSAPRS
ncbi:hypothetical protein WDZ16_16210 [Pseudokineococcus marinus]|uniref:Uncharacterized protein n=1 Tax=Pseudokineococcus marinus TaxID=351215 RepID=A0A849BMT1_9ACTN|nr:hypothetical protein [Pseudokineococcus marinus]NNH22092.1 hypothetical protein [Pseudokineococcus marinus]